MNDTDTNIEASNIEESSQSFKDYFKNMSAARAKAYCSMDFADGNNWDNWTFNNFRDSNS